MHGASGQPNHMHANHIQSNHVHGASGHALGMHCASWMAGQLTCSNNSEANWSMRQMLFHAVILDASSAEVRDPSVRLMKLHQSKMRGCQCMCSCISKCVHTPAVCGHQFACTIHSSISKGRPERLCLRTCVFV